MEVSSKFNIGDKVYFIADNKVQKSDITGVSISVNGGETKVEYTLHFDSTIDESLVFATKEELIKSL